jgi:hypothetical protein
LPLIIKWLKQTFAARFNAQSKRRGHLWAGRAKIRLVSSPPAECPQVPERR